MIPRPLSPIPAPVFALGLRLCAKRRAVLDAFGSTLIETRASLLPNKQPAAVLVGADPVPSLFDHVVVQLQAEDRVEIRSQPITKEDRMAFLYKLENEDGTPADPPTLRNAVSTWRPGDTIPLGRDRGLRVIDTRLDEGTDGDPVSVLIVEAA
jgi:hypothetical protein